MTKTILYCLLLCFSFNWVSAQANLDTLAIQDFETTPATPTWNFTGPVVYSSGFSSATATPANSPLGIGGSRAWNTTSVSGGILLEFANVIIPAGYDSVRVRFNLAAMNLNGATGGPDDLDYVLTEVSTNGGATYYNRLRIRGALANNCSWAYSATGYAKVYYQPASETTFQPANSGLQTTEGYSTCEIVFPGSVSSVRIRITGRSSSASDTWLVDNVVIIGQGCNSSQAVSASICDGDAYTLPGGSVVTASGVYSDTLTNSGGCDSVINTTLSVLSIPQDTLYAEICNGESYTLPGGSVVTFAGAYVDTFPTANNCDSLVTTLLTVRPTNLVSNTITICDGQTYTLPNGQVVSTTGLYSDTLQNVFGCDSIMETQVNVVLIDLTVSTAGTTLSANAVATSYQWLDCDNGLAPIAGATNQSFTPVANGNYACAISINNCVDTTACNFVLVVGLESSLAEGIRISPNPANQVVTIQGSVEMLQAPVHLYDLQGRILTVYIENGASSKTLDLHTIPAGVYLLNIEGYGWTRIQKVD